MFDSRSFYADIKPVSGLTLELRMESAAKKSSNVIGFYCVNRRLGQVAVDGRQLGLSFENNVGGILGLIHTPVIAHAE